ncbi:hypothetical protein WN51_08084 [Melipona quadrifasciata]|uniref:CASP8-associated protein 2 n=1 Tax=Melipona quadrifasciata TaxID=166423 RepID=A0A0N0BBU8_9HYME|nr:hypothetical protein WN51_08084 [Melipona quadrifasciata]
MEDDIDIYADLPDFGPEFSKNFVSRNEENIAEKQLELKKQIAELTTKLENSQKVNKNLEINLFSLLKTAKAEIARKDKMIDELRKRLDDATFRRSSYSKDYVIRKSTLSTTVTNTHQKSIDICFSVNEKDTQMSVSNSLSNQSKAQQNKSTLVPITIFGERLLKRMTDEQNLEKKDKSNKLNNSEKDDKNNAGYTVESDKENGFSCDTNFDNTKEIQSSVIAQYKGTENLLASSGSTTKDVQLNNKNETSTTFQRKPTLTYTGKRANEEENRQIHVKRMKPSGEKHCSEVTKKETDNDIVSESKERSAFPRYNDFGFSDYSNERDHNKKYSEYARTLSMEQKKHGYSIHDANKANERRDTKNKGDKRDMDDHSLKRRKSTQTSTSISDKKDTSYRCVEVFERDNCRRSHSKHRSSRDKQKEYHRADDHRSRARSTSYTKLYQEEKYHRNQYNKYSDHDGKFEERCNFRNSGAANKSKISRKDSYNDRQTKHSTIDRISTDQRFDEIKKAQCRYNEPRKVRNIDKSIKQHDEDKQDEYSECSRSRRNFDAENLIEHSKYSQVLKEIDGKDNGTTQTANALEIGNKLRKYAEEELKNPSINLEDDEISASGNKNSSKDTCDKYERSKDQQDTDVGPPEDPSFAVNNISVKSTVSNETEKSKASINVVRTIPIFDTNIACSPDEKLSKNIESVENIENIEKFIRSSVSTCDKALKNMSGASNTAFNNLQSGSIEKEMQGNANAPSSSSDNGMSLIENRQTDKNVTNVATSNENNSVKYNYTETQSELRTTLLQENERASNQLKTESNVLETVKKAESQEKSNDTSANTASDLDIRNNYHNINDCDEDEINQNSPEDVTNTSSKHENENTSIATEVTRGKECDKYIGKTEEIELRLFKKPLEKSINHSNTGSTKDSMNVYGKIVVFARRKKPVCLANSNANMTVLINNKHDTGVDLSIANIGKMNGHDTTNTS